MLQQSVKSYPPAMEINRCAANGIAKPCDEVDAVYYVIFSTKVYCTGTKFIQALMKVIGAFLIELIHKSYSKSMALARKCHFSELKIFLR